MEFLSTDFRKNSQNRNVTLCDNNCLKAKKKRKKKKKKKKKKIVYNDIHTCDVDIFVSSLLSTFIT